jgi:hypothetical protein
MQRPIRKRCAIGDVVYWIYSEYRIENVRGGLSKNHGTNSR